MATVIAFGTNKQAYYDLFIESCKRHNINPVLLGWNEKWVGFGKKTTDIRDYIKKLPKDEIVISVDPFDVVFLCGLDEIEKNFRESSAKYICGAMRLGPILGYVYNTEFNKTGMPVRKTQSGYNYANTGTWIARAGDAIELIDRLVKDYSMTDTDVDQEIITGIYINDNTAVDIDWKCKIFHNLLFRDFITRRADMKDIEFREGRIYNRATKTYPCILHASGNARMEDIALKLGYDKKTATPADNNLNFLKKALFHITKLYRLIAAIILVAAAVVFLTIFFIEK